MLTLTARRMLSPGLLPACLAVTLAMTLTIPAAQAGDPPLLPIDDPDLQRCARLTLPDRTLTQTQRVTVTSDDGWSRESERRMYWKRIDPRTVAILFEVDKPAADAGLKVLLRRVADAEPVIYVYTPDTGKARRMVGGGAANSILGTDLSYEDARHFDSFLSAADTRRQPDTTLDGHPVYVIATRPDRERSAYARIVTHIDSSLCVPLLTEFFSPSGARVKSIQVARDTVAQIGEQHFPTEITVRDHQLGSVSTFEISDVAVNRELRDSLFSFAAIRQSR